MATNRLSLRSRIFLYMILLVVVASILIALVTIYQYSEQSKDYHMQRLARKEVQLLSSMNYVLKETSWPIDTEHLGLIFKDEIYKIADYLNVGFNLYYLDGTLIKSSKYAFLTASLIKCISTDILNQLSQSIYKKYINIFDFYGGDCHSS